MKSSEQVLDAVLSEDVKNSEMHGKKQRVYKKYIRLITERIDEEYLSASQAFYSVRSRHPNVLEGEEEVEEIIDRLDRDVNASKNADGLSDEDLFRCWELSRNALRAMASLPQYTDEEKSRFNMYQTILTMKFSLD